MELSEVFGFNQKRLVELHLDSRHATLLRFFVDYTNTPIIERIIADNDVYYELQYERFIQELPIAKSSIENVHVFHKLLRDLVDSEVLQQYETTEDKVKHHYYALSQNYLGLISGSEGKK